MKGKRKNAKSDSKFWKNNLCKLCNHIITKIRRSWGSRETSSSMWTVSHCAKVHNEISEDKLLNLKENIMEFLPLPPTNFKSS